MDRGMANDQISKTLGISESTIGYNRERPNNLISKRSPRLPKNI
jgi:DNA-binding NarL/FixJ family response regulator